MKTLNTMILFFTVCFLLVVVVFIALGFKMVENNNSKREALDACLRAGYSEVRRGDGIWFCYRLVNGTEEVVPLEDVRDQE